MRLLIKLSAGIARKWRSHDGFATVSVLPLEESINYPYFDNYPIPVRELAAGYEVSMPPVPSRIEAVLPDGERLEKELRDSVDGGQIVEVLLGRRKRPRTFTDFGRRAEFRSVAYDSDRRAARRTSFRDRGELVSYTPAYDGTAFSYVSPDRRIPLADLGVRWFAQTVERSGADVKASTFDSTLEISSWLGIGDSTDRVRFQEPLPELASVQVTSRQMIAELDSVGLHLDRPFDATYRRYSVLESIGSTFVIPMPVEHERQASMTVDVRLTAPDRDGLIDVQKIKVEAQPKEPLLASLLTLVQQGQIASARSIIAASQMLYQKFDNPYLAALGAHVLLGADGARHDDGWHGWVENLARHFPLIPDGKIVLAALMLRRGSGLHTISRSMSDSEVVQAAKNTCLEALEVGLPQYSASVRLLARTAGIIAGFEQGQKWPLWHDGGATQKLLGLTQWLSAHVDPKQGLTVAQFEKYEPEYA